MKVYLDTCSIQRPLDSKSHMRIVLEAEAIQGIITQSEAGDLELISSDIVLFEINRITHPIRREYALAVLSKASEKIAINREIQRQANEFTKLGIKSVDALHLASAEWGKADYFCTCDDKFLKKAKTLDLRVKVVSPVELIEELE